MKLRKSLLKVLELSVIVIMGLLVLDVLWGVLTRYALVNASKWSEEAATILLIWVSLLGASVAFMEKSHLGVDYFVGKLSHKLRTIVEIVVYLGIVFFATAVMIWGGGQLISITLMTKQTTAALGVKMGHVYLALPISGFFITLFSLETIVEKACQFGKQPETVESE